MLLNCFENFEIKNPFFEGRFVSKKDERVASLAGIAHPWGRKREVEVENTEAPKQPKKRPAEQPREKPKDRLQRRKKEVTDSTRRKLARERGIKDFERKKFPKDVEGPRLKPYIDAIGIAFDKFKENPKRLYDFLMNHREYMSKKGGVLQNYSKWNEDFYKAFGLKPINANIPEEKEQGLYAGALQFYLSKYFDKSMKIDVFDLTKGRRANPFMRVDDKIGAYTVSVLAAYWNRNFAGKFKLKDKPIGKLDYSNLAEEYGAKSNGKNQIFFDKAIHDLREKLGEKGKGLPKKPGKAQDEFVGPLESKTTKKGSKVVSDKERKRLEEIGKKLLSKKEIQARKDKEWNDAMDRIKKPGEYLNLAESLTRAMLVGAPVEITRERFEKEFNDLRDDCGEDPNKVSWSDYETSIPISRENWSYLIFQKYKEAYNKAKANPTDANKKRSDELYRMLKGSANDFYQETKNVIDKLKAKYKTNVAILAGMYDLPHSVGIANLSPIVRVYKQMGYRAHWSKEENPQYKLQKGKVLSKHLREPKAINAFFKKYFKERPKRTFRTPEELSKSLTKPMKDIREFIGVSPEGIRDRINHIILLGNMHTVHWTSDWYRKKFDKELKVAKATMLASYETYYRNYKGKKGKDFAGDILAGKLKK